MTQDNDDRHKTARLSGIVAVVVSAIFAAIGVAGYQRTEDSSVLLLFLGLALLSFFVVKFLFVGINKLLDSLDR